MRKISLLGEIKHTFVSIAKGLWVTLSHIPRKKVTVMYPEEKLETSEAFRGMISLPVDPETGTDRCIACGACARICPEGIIDIQSELDENKKRKLTGFNVDFSRCMWCGLCTEVCPKQSLLMSNFYEAATDSRQGMVYDRDILHQIGGMFPEEPKEAEEAEEKEEESESEA